MTASPIPDHGRVVEPATAEAVVQLVHEYRALRESLNLSPSGVLALSKELARLQAVETLVREILPEIPPDDRDQSADDRLENWKSRVREVLP